MVFLSKVFAYFFFVNCLFTFIFRFVYDEMTKNGRIAMLKGVTPVDSTTIALTVGPINTSNMKIRKGK